MSYQEAKEVYAKIGVDTEQAIENLKIPQSRCIVGKATTL